MSGIFRKNEPLPLHSRTSVEWAQNALNDPIALLVDHAFLEKKAALNVMELMTRWPGEWLPGWVETMTGIARDEASHLAQVVRLITKRGGRMGRFHKNPYANDLRGLIRKGDMRELLDRLLVSAIIELRSCERFAVLSEVAAGDAELAAFYKALWSSEMGHYKVFVRLAGKMTKPAVLEQRWQELLAAEVKILAAQEPGSRIHSGPGN